MPGPDRQIRATSAGFVNPAGADNTIQLECPARIGRSGPHLRDLPIPQEQTIQSSLNARPGSADPGHVCGICQSRRAGGTIPQEQTIQA
ncbi:MAG: hypothetical protein DRI57_32575 [Deltaproteobacteria bacterium]|nr:MAG: hypothetical protein DRI57_32575 [Deltaproteobacteria bacterium]